MPNHYLGLDVGSTTVGTVIIDIDNHGVVGASSAANTTSLSPSAPGRSEWNLTAMTDIAIANASALIERTGVEPAAIGVTGQQQGLQLLDTGNNPVGPYISWQDQRAKELVPGEQRTWLEMMGELGGARVEDSGLPNFANTGCPLMAGYTAPHLFWLLHSNQLPAEVTGITAPEFVVSRLTDEQPVTDPTDAIGWGVFNVKQREWDFDLIDALGLPRSLLPPLAPSCSIAGHVSADVSDQLGIRAGKPVAVASGDHQCSFAGTVANYLKSAAVNVGTGGQSSVYVESPLPRGWLELRPHIQSGYLLAGVGMVGGRTFRAFRDFFRSAVFDLGDVETDANTVYTQLVELAAKIPRGAEGVSVNPLFNGSPREPLVRAAVHGLTPATFTAGHLARALFEAVAVQLVESYRQAVAAGAEQRTRVVGSGNGILLNPVLREALAEEFGMPLELARHKEQAAVGAALCAAVADGAFPSISEASAAFTRDRPLA